MEENITRESLRAWAAEERDKWKSIIHQHIPALANTILRSFTNGSANHNAEHNTVLVAGAAVIYDLTQKEAIRDVLESAPIPWSYVRPLLLEELRGRGFSSRHIKKVAGGDDAFLIHLDAVEGDAVERTINLGNHWIFVRLEENRSRGSVTSDLKVHTTDPGDEEYNARVDAVESLVLAHAMAGVDVFSAAYAEGLETTLERIADQ